MGLEKLNPFKKSAKKAAASEGAAGTSASASAGATSGSYAGGAAHSNSLAPPQDGLAPTKSTSSIAHSIRSMGSRAEDFLQGGERPREVFKRDGHVDASRQLPTISTGGNTLSPSPSHVL